MKEVLKMKLKIKNQFLLNYIIMFLISIIVTVGAFLLLSFFDDMVSKTLMKNNYTASSLMKDDYQQIDFDAVVQNGGGVQIVNDKLTIVRSEGINKFLKDSMTVSEFTQFLINSKKVGVPFNYSIEYNERQHFWLIVSFPTSIRVDFKLVHNDEYESKDAGNVSTVILAVIILYLLLLAGSTVIYSKISAIRFVNPLKKLMHLSMQLRDGDYSARANIKLKNEFGELQDTLNSMATRIEEEITLRKQSEENRQKLVLDISHDLKNPLASIMGYAELYKKQGNCSKEEIDQYMDVIYENSIRANHLILDLFELSKLERSEFRLQKTEIELVEYLRQVMSEYISDMECKSFEYEFDFPEIEINVFIDKIQMNRVFQNLYINTLRCNPPGTKVSVSLTQQQGKAFIIFRDNGIGIPKELAEDIFHPFVTSDSLRNSETGGSGLGLAIVKKIIEIQGGEIKLNTDSGQGCEFIITIPTI